MSFACVEAKAFILPKNDTEFRGNLLNLMVHRNPFIVSNFVWSHSACRIVKIVQIRVPSSFFNQFWVDKIAEPLWELAM